MQYPLFRPLFLFVAFVSSAFFSSGLRADTYRWTAGGDGYSLYGERNWTLVGGNGETIPKLNPKDPVRHDLLITGEHAEKTVGGGGGFKPDLVMGGAKLTVTGGKLMGGNWTPHGGAGIRNDWHAEGRRSPMVVSGGEVLVGFLADIACEVSGAGELGLRHPFDPLPNSTIEIDPAFTGVIRFTKLIPEEVETNQIQKITVGGSPAKIGENVILKEDGDLGCSLRIKPPGTDNSKPRQPNHEITDARRTWTDLKGRTVEGELVGADRTAAVVKLKDKPVRIALAKLCQSDRDYVARWLARRHPAGNATKTSTGTQTKPETPTPGPSSAPSRAGMTADFDAPIPEKTGPPPPFTANTLTEDRKSAVFVYTTPHFEFHSDRQLTARVVSGFSLIYEATYEAVRAMPWGARFTPGGNDGRFVVRLFSDEKSFLEAGGLPGSAGTAVGPLSLVQIRSLGVRDTGKRLILKNIKANTVLVHELTHALRDDADRHWPIWAIEGAAEYIACTPYRKNGTFDFSDQLKAAVNYVASKRGIRNSFIPPVDLENFLNMSRSEFYGQEDGVADSANPNYAATLLIYTWFWHADRGANGQSKPGAPIRAWAKALANGQNEQSVRHLLLDGRTHREVEKAIAKDYRRLIKIKFK